jgi:putative transposase
MPGREEPLVTNEIYHVFNRGITDLQTYSNRGDYSRFIDTFKYYLPLPTLIRFSHFIRLPESRKTELLQQVSSNFRVDLMAYCLMPNHFHLLLKQKVDEGIPGFLGLITNSYTRYFNTKNHRVGPIFQGRFKAVRIENENQLLHVSRYIHLNPYSSGIVSRPGDLENYPYSSFPEYLYPQVSKICRNEQIINLFRGSGEYRDFVLDHSDHQRQLEYIKHLTLDL